MELKYQNTREDFKAYYEWLWSEQKTHRRAEYYWSLLWYVSVLSVAIYIGMKHDEEFAVCVFAVLAFLHIKQNWSFEKRWSEHVKAQADAFPKSASRLVLDDQGINEQFSGVEVRVPWSEIRGYTSQEERLFIHFLKQRAFIVPFLHVSIDQREKLIGLLEKNQVNH